MPKGYKVVIEEATGGGNWKVCVYRERFPFPKRITSDWFLDKVQADEYARVVRAAIDGGVSVDRIISRQPGWHLFPSDRQGTFSGAGGG